MPYSKGRSASSSFSYRTDDNNIQSHWKEFIRDLATIAQRHIKLQNTLDKKIINKVHC